MCFFKHLWQLVFMVALRHQVDLKSLISYVYNQVLLAFKKINNLNE